MKLLQELNVINSGNFYCINARHVSMRLDYWFLSRIQAEYDLSSLRVWWGIMHLRNVSKVISSLSCFLIWWWESCTYGSRVDIQRTCMNNMLIKTDKKITLVSYCCIYVLNVWWWSWNVNLHIILQCQVRFSVTFCNSCLCNWYCMKVAMYGYPVSLFCSQHLVMWCWCSNR